MERDTSQVIDRRGTNWARVWPARERARPPGKVSEVCASIVSQGRVCCAVGVLGVITDNEPPPPRMDHPDPTWPQQTPTNSIPCCGCLFEVLCSLGWWQNLFAGGQKSRNRWVWSRWLGRTVAPLRGGSPHIWRRCLSLNSPLWPTCKATSFQTKRAKLKSLKCCSQFNSQVWQNKGDHLTLEKQEDLAIMGNSCHDHFLQAVAHQASFLWRRNLWIIEIIDQHWIFWPQLWEWDPMINHHWHTAPSCVTFRSKLGGLKLGSKEAPRWCPRFWLRYLLSDFVASYPEQVFVPSLR